MEEKTNQEIIESVASAGTVLPMVALRGKVIFPGVVTSFDVGRQMSLAAIDVAANNNMDIFIATQKDIAIEAPTSADIFTVGVVCRIRQIVKMPGNNARVSVQGMYRARIENSLENSKFCEVEVERLYLLEEDPALVEANLRVAQASFKEYVAATKLSKEVTGNVENITDPAEFTDTATFYMHFKEADKQAILEENSVIGRLKRFDELLAYEQTLKRRYPHAFAKALIRARRNTIFASSFAPSTPSLVTTRRRERSFAAV